MKPAGHRPPETHPRHAGEPGGHHRPVTLKPAAARRISKTTGHGIRETHGRAAGGPGGQACNEAPDSAAARRNSTAGHSPLETQGKGAGEPGGQSGGETHGEAAARRKSKTAGHQSSETQRTIAGEPGGHGPPVAHTSSAARRKSIAGQERDETQRRTARNGAVRGHRSAETQTENAAVRAAIDALIEVGRRDTFAIRQRMRIRQATLSHIARSEFGYHAHLPEAERKTAMDATAKLVKAMRAGQEHPLSMLVHATDAAAAPWEEIQSQAEKVMAKLARQLPAYAWVQGVRGFGDLSFARIIAETGDLSAYDNPAKVWKRLGLAVLDGRSQRRTRDAEKAVEQGYNPQRRSVSWVAFHSVYLAQSARKDSGDQWTSGTQPASVAEGDGASQQSFETPDGGAGPYRLLYDTKKSEYLERVAAGETGWMKFRADRAAKRYAEKRLLRDLWVAWHKDIAGHHRRETQFHAAGDGDRGGQLMPETQEDAAAPVAAE